MPPPRARIEPIVEPTPEQKEALDTVTITPTGRAPSNVFSTLAHHPRLLKQFSRFGGTLLFRGLVPARERELVILRVGWNCQSVYEFGQHTLLGRTAGLSDDEITALAGGDTSGFARHERSLIAMADELCSGDLVSEPTWAELSERWSDAELVELLLLAGYYRLVSGFLNSAGVQLDQEVPAWP
jgi:alkylhydroperoxidase family enzyme